MQEASGVDPQFQWGTKKGIGGAKKDVQFYESFILDGVHYKLYDCVYLFKNDETEPYIGKIVKIWQQGDGKKKVKILWFFQPREISNYLGEDEPLEKEIFLASGEGIGLSNINPLEAVDAKCSVICTSNDARNLLPSKDALERADFIFYRTFDVKTLTISDELPDKIAGIDVMSLLNQKGDLVVSPVVKPDEAKGFAMKGIAEADNTSHAPSNLKILKLVKTDEPGQTAVLLKDDVIDKKHQNEAKPYPSGSSSRKQKNESTGEVKETSNSMAHPVYEMVTSVKHKAESDMCDSKPAKKIRLGDNLVKHEDLQKDKHAIGAKKTITKSEEDNSGKASVKLLKKNSGRVNPSEKKVVSPSDSLEKDSSVSVKESMKQGLKISEENRRPDADRSKWFKGLPWESRIQKAHEQGTLVLLQNFEPSLTSTDIEDVMYDAFKQICVAKVFPILPPSYSPHYGQAYVIFKTQDAANLATQKINMGCLMIANGSPVIASKGILAMPPKLTTLTGHLVINKIKLMQREDMKKAVSTSHCSQPNTIEYEMAMDWILLQAKTVKCLNQLYKWHGDDRKRVKKKLKTIN